MPLSMRPSSRRIVFCSGKVFYELHAEREKRGLDKDNSVALVRLEQVRALHQDDGLPQSAHSFTF